MIDDLKSLYLFAKTVEYGSFRAAARSLNVSPSVVSYQISQLEKRYGVALLYRSTRNLSLTDTGSHLFEQAKTMIDSSQRSIDLLSGTAQQPVGKLTVSLPAAFARSPLLSTISDFAKACPQVDLSIGFSDVHRDLIAEGIDLAIRAGDLDDSSLMAKRVQIYPRRLVAAPDFLKGKKIPGKPEEIKSWQWIKHDMLPASRKFKHTDGTSRNINYSYRVSVDNVDGMCELVKSGLGLATLPHFLVDDDIRSGRLIELLPDWEVEPLKVSAVWPANAPRESLTRRLLDYLVDSTDQID